jgi:hypothetical protein
MRLRFVPDSPGPARATLQWRSDATNPTTVALTGSAVEPVPPVPAPSPTPTGQPEPTGGDGGGCSAGLAERRVDPTLPFALLLAAWGLLARAMQAKGLRRRRQLLAQRVSPEVDRPRF